MIYKLIGTVLIILSAMYFICSKLIVTYFTYMYLEDVVWILRQMKNACSIGKTYNSVYRKTKNLRYYCSDGLSLLVDKNRSMTSKDILNSTGKRSKREEQEYLDYSIEKIENLKAEYKNYTDINKKTFILTGFSLGLIVVIVLI
ncbi:MAG: hypothetical protein IJN77_08190 [Oscillospiraceae bacterium]|nr:hypothetical protein [Oscillospiraceae bacterium]